MLETLEQVGVKLRVEMGRLKFGVLLPKMLLGSLQLEWKQCGRDRCRCAAGDLHGPYWYRHWRDKTGKQRKQYVRLDRVEQFSIAIAQQRVISGWSVRQALAKIRRVEKELHNV